MKGGLRNDAVGLLMIAVGALAAQMVISGDLILFVKPVMRWPLAASAAVLVVAGVFTLLRRHDHERHDHAGHDHDDHAPRIGLLLVLPLLAVLLVAPTSLGSDAAASRTIEIDPTAQLGPLPPAVDGVVEMSLLEVMKRAAQGADGELGGVDLRLVGFVSERYENGFQLTRFRIACCAADALVATVRVDGVDPPTVDEWVVVLGQWDPSGDEATIRAVSIQRIAAPENPYE